MDEVRADNDNVSTNIQQQQTNATSRRYESPVSKKSGEQNPLYTSGTSEMPS